MRCAFPPYKGWLLRQRGACEAEKDQEQPIEIPGFWNLEAAKSSQDRQDEPAFEMARAVGNGEIPSEQGIFCPLAGK
jgi:hypothetical protein